MSKILLMANVNRSQIEITNTHYNIKSIPITVDDAVMNGVLYSKAENAKGLPTMVGNPITLGHPVIDGQNKSAHDGEALDDFYSGGTVRKVFNKSGVWYANASIKKALLNAQDGGKEYADLLDGKENIGVSTGLSFDDNQITGTNNRGDDYTKSAINQHYDHLAMLANEAPAGGDDTVMRFNVADIIPEEKESFAKKVLNKVFSLVHGNELSHSDINEKIYKKLNKNRTGDICSFWPMEVFDDSFVYRGENDRLFKQSYSKADDEITFIGEKIEVEREVEFKPINNNNGDRIMRDKILAALNAAKVETDGLDDNALFAAYNGLNDQGGEGKSAANALTAESLATAINEAINPLQETITKLQGDITANADKELTQARADVVAINKGIDKDMADAMTIESCNKFLAANGHVAFNASGYKHTNTDNGSMLDIEMPMQKGE